MKKFIKFLGAALAPRVKRAFGQGLLLRRSAISAGVKFRRKLIVSGFTPAPRTGSASFSLCCGALLAPRVKRRYGLAHRKPFSLCCGALLCLLVLNLSAFAYQVTADAQTKRIPQGTKLNLQMGQNVLSDSINTGDMFSAYLTQDVIIDNIVVLPEGTIVRGNVSGVTSAKRLSRSAILYLNFDHIVAPNGAQLPVKAGLYGTYQLDDKGGIKGGGNYGAAIQENWSKSGAMIKKATKWGITSGEELFTGGKYLVTPFSAVGGTIAGAFYFTGSSIADLFKKGNSVCIKKGELFKILLLEPLDVSVSE